MSSEKKYETIQIVCINDSPYGTYAMDDSSYLLHPKEIEIEKSYLTKGKIYETILSEFYSSGSIEICNDEGVKKSYSKSRFVSLEKYRDDKINKILE